MRHRITRFAGLFPTRSLSPVGITEWDDRRFGKSSGGGGGQDPAAAARAQGEANKEAVRESAKVNQINEVTPWGDLFYSGEIGESDRTRTTSLTPPGQNQLDIMNRIAQALGYKAEGLAGGVNSDPFSLSGLPPAASIRGAPQGRQFAGAFGLGTHGGSSGAAPPQSTQSTEPWLTGERAVGLGLGRNVMKDLGAYSGFDLPQEHSTTKDTPEGYGDGQVAGSFWEGLGKPENVGGVYGQWEGSPDPLFQLNTATDGAGPADWSRDFTYNGKQYQSTMGSQGEMISSFTPAASETTTTPGASLDDVNALLRSNQEFRDFAASNANVSAPPGWGQAAPGSSPGPQLPPGIDLGGAFGISGGNELLDAAQPVEQATYDRVMDLANPGYDRRFKDMRNDLTSRGFGVGDEAWNRSMTEFGEGRDMFTRGAANDAVIAGRAEQSRLFGLGQAERSTALNERLGERNQRINEIAMALGASPSMQMPNFAPTAQYQVAPAPIMGAAQMSNQMAMANNANATSSSNAMWGALGGLGAAGITAF